MTTLDPKNRPLRGARDVALEESDMWTVTTLTWPPTAILPTLTTVCAGTTTTCASDTGIVTADGR